MTTETLFTAIIPAILIFCLVFFNIRKMQKQAKIMRIFDSCSFRYRVISP